MITPFKLFGVSLARRRTRRIVVLAYWCVPVPFLCTAFLLNFQRHGFTPIDLLLLLPLPAILGGYSPAGLVKPFNPIPFPPGPGALESRLGAERAKAVLESLRLDELEESVKERAHRTAYALLRWTGSAAAVAYGVESAFFPAWSAVCAAMGAFLLVIALWCLPQSVILWTVPDLDPSVANETLEVPCEQN
jgi:hypothetical protein